MMVCETKQVSFEPVFETLHRWSISYGDWDFIPNPWGTVAHSLYNQIFTTVMMPI